MFCNSISIKSGKSNDTTHGENAMEVKLPAEKIMLWHHRLGHIGEKGLKTLKNKNLVEGLVDYKLEFIKNKIVFSFIPILKNLLVCWTIFILMCLVLWMFLLYLIQDIMYHLLMIIQEEHLFILFLKIRSVQSV